LDEGIRDYADSNAFSAADKLALRYSELMANDPGAIDAKFFDALRAHYSATNIASARSIL